VTPGNARFLGRFRHVIRLTLLLGLVFVAAAGVRPTTRAHAGTMLQKRSLRQVHRSPRAATWRKATNFARPAFRPSRTITVETAAGFWHAWNRLRPRDEILVHGVTFKGEVKLLHKQLDGWAEIRFDSATKFVGVASAINLAAVWIDGVSHVRFYGGDVSDSASGGMAGTGVVVYDSSYLSWWGLKIHNVGGAGMYITGIKRASDHVDFKADVSAWGHNLKWDPHPEKGTGLQGVNVGDSHYGVNHSRFAFHVHDSPVGSGLEMGGAVATDGVRGNEAYVWCRNLTIVTPDGQAGNCVQLWGQNVTGNTFRYILAQHLSGRPYQTSGMFANQSLATDRVVYGRAARTNLNRAYGTIRWDARYGTVFENVGGA
jgi:hypothetical protein